MSFRTAECKQCKKACENNHVNVQELPDTQALSLCHIKEQATKGTCNYSVATVVCGIFFFFYSTNHTAMPVYARPEGTLKNNKKDANRLSMVWSGHFFRPWTWTRGHDNGRLLSPNDTASSDPEQKTYE